MKILPKFVTNSSLLNKFAEKKQLFCLTVDYFLDLQKWCWELGNWDIDFFNFRHRQVRNFKILNRSERDLKFAVNFRKHQKQKRNLTKYIETQWKQSIIPWNYMKCAATIGWVSNGNPPYCGCLNTILPGPYRWVSFSSLVKYLECGLGWLSCVKKII
jgi:hypothetical protein